MKPIILDSTLREGQLYRIFSREVNRQIAVQLAETGIPRIELTVDYPPRTTYEDVAYIIDALSPYDVEVVMHGRAYQRDIEAMSKYDVDGCALYLAPTDIHREYKLGGLSYEEAVQRMEESVEIAKSFGFKYIRATVEDASRFYFDGQAGMERLEKLIDSMGDAGASLVSVPDTAGMLSPKQARDFISTIKRRCRTPISCHFHNDYGYASANTVEAVAEGADEAHVCVLGIGDRNGIADLYEVVAGLEDIYNISTGVKRDAISKLYEKFSKLTGIRPYFSHPLSKEARTVRAGVHQSMVVKMPRGYVPEKKLIYDFNGSLVFEATPYLSHKIIERLLSKYGVKGDEARRITEMLASNSSNKGRKLLPSEVRDILVNAGIQVKMEDVSSIFGTENAYILIKLKPQFPASKIIGELMTWDDVDSVDEVYGDVDMVVKARVLPSDGNVISRLKKTFSDVVEEVKVLITD
ncbi:MAG: hypothetical protein QXO01_03905 [Nitrososphaerota archaeon]